MIREKVFTLVLLVALTGCVSTPVKVVEQQQAIEIDNKTVIKPIAITKVAGKMRRGTNIGDVQVGYLCLKTEDITWRSGSKINLTSDDLADVFREELESNGWPVVGTTDNLFEGYDVSGAEILVATLITDVHANICYPHAGWGNYRDAKGELRLKAEWQIYSPFTRSIITTINTEGSAVISRTTSEASDKLLYDAFSVAVNNLLASQEFFDAVRRSDLSSTTSDRSNRVIIENNIKTFKSVSDALESAKLSTVTVRVANSHGSGFAIGDGGLIITNAHVVGNAQNVTIVVNGGISLTGKVEIVDQQRDVALISLADIKLTPLAIDVAKFNTGSEVYALGSPLTEDLSGTVTKGIISSYRTYEGLNWIQSDVAVSPGNSGGPLISKEGRVIGVTTAGFQASGSQVGLNLFTPISDALKHLNLSLE